MSNDELIKIEVDELVEKEQGTYKSPIQSADTLFHFVDKIEYLLPAIEKLAIVPRYVTEDIDYLQIGMDKIAYPMLCFCDINLHKMQEHIEFYGGYGIAFSKKWGIDKGIQPLQYINKNSILQKDFSKAFQDSINEQTSDSAQNFLLSQMYYFKAIDGSMERSGELVYKNFTDECEWRYIPDVKSISLPQAITEQELFSKNTCNDALILAESCWLKFAPDDVKYIIIKKDDEFELISQAIKSSVSDISKQEKLLSKILIWSDVRRDL